MWVCWWTRAGIGAEWSGGVFGGIVGVDSWIVGWLCSVDTFYFTGGG